MKDHHRRAWPRCVGCGRDVSRNCKCKPQLPARGYLWRSRLAPHIKAWIGA